ncbi:putative glycosyltransferase EpsF [Clostridium polyendosporum]|uniref:Glycosyltransferase EpsF n=1 Tax=Clostridium polyendosporum TaxID=69208 RepID=A0A919RZV7_9CLOT|nr:glycosyltransferase family 1 protein [Clostridium polyendosporum]GIM28751.1 putative glycosyltransferase EpsF [Clostridium polyendosporum]
MIKHNKDDKIPRILQITGGMNTGGAETMIMHLYRTIDKSKVQFDFISFTDAKCHYDDEIKALGGRIFYVPSPKKTNLFKFIVDLYRVIKQYGPYHAVHAHTLFNSGLALLAARLAGIKLRICHSHNTLGDYGHILIRKIYFAFMRVLIKLNSNKNVSCTKAAGKFLFGKRSIRKQMFTVLPNAIDLTPYKYIDLNAVRSMRKKLGINEDTLVIGHVGKFGEQKNHIFLVRLAEYLRDKEVDFKLILIGQGDLKKQIEAMIEEKQLNEHVKFLGVQTNIPLYMRMFDVFVLPSLYEGLGIVLIEAQAAGTPCVISDTIPKECDMGLGLINMLSLNAKLDSWLNAILNSSKTKRISSSITTGVILKNGYNLDTTVKTLIDIYQLSI